MARIDILTPRACCLYLQALAAWLPRLDTQPIDEYEDDDEELTDEERRHFDELERQFAVFCQWLWNHGAQKDYGKLSLRWAEDGQLELKLDKRAVNRLLNFLCNEQARRLRDVEYDV